MNCVCILQQFTKNPHMPHRNTPEQRQKTDNWNQFSLGQFLWLSYLVQNDHLFLVYRRTVCSWWKLIIFADAFRFICCENRNQHAHVHTRFSVCAFGCILVRVCCRLEWTSTCSNQLSILYFLRVKRMARWSMCARDFAIGFAHFYLPQRTRFVRVENVVMKFIMFCALFKSCTDFGSYLRFNSKLEGLTGLCGDWKL